MSNGTFDFNLFLEESKNTLLNPKSYFSSMKTSGGITEPLIKAVIYGTLTGIISLLWSILKISAAGAGFIGGAVGIMAFIGSIIFALIGLFVGAVILLIIASICKGNSDYEANLRVTASLMVVMPVSAIFGFTGGISFYLGVIITLVIQAYALWLLYNGLVESLKCNAGTSRIVTYVLLALVVIITLASISGSRRAARMFDDYTKDAREILKDMENN